MSAHPPVCLGTGSVCARCTKPIYALQGIHTALGPIPAPDVTQYQETLSDILSVYYHVDIQSWLAETTEAQVTEYKELPLCENEAVARLVLDKIRAYAMNRHRRSLQEDPEISMPTQSPHSLGRSIVQSKKPGQIILAELLLCVNQNKYMIFYLCKSNSSEKFGICTHSTFEKKVSPEEELDKNFPEGKRILQDWASQSNLTPQSTIFDSSAYGEAKIRFVWLVQFCGQKYAETISYIYIQREPEYTPETELSIAMWKLCKQTLNTFDPTMQLLELCAIMHKKHDLQHTPTLYLFFCENNKNGKTYSIFAKGTVQPLPTIANPGSMPMKRKADHA
jgi:hypothetical protein